MGTAPDRGCRGMLSDAPAVIILLSRGSCAFIFDSARVFCIDNYLSGKKISLRFHFAPSPLNCGIVCMI